MKMGFLNPYNQQQDSNPKIKKTKTFPLNFLIESSKFSNRGQKHRKKSFVKTENKMKTEK